MRNPNSPEWLERANYLALVARQLSTTIHDVNNILQVISGHAELLQHSPGASEAGQKRGQTIAAQALRATTMLSDLAGFARDAGDRTEVVGLREITQRAMSMRSQALSRLKVSSVLEGHEVKVRGNSRRLLQIVLNLILNAEHALNGSPLPQLRVAVSPSGDRVVLHVEDNAVERTEPNPEPLHDRGAVSQLGIGFTVSEWLARAQGGTLERSPLPRGGTRATLSLPVA